MNNVIACVSTYLSRKPHDNRPDAYRPLRVRVSLISLGLNSNKKGSMKRSDHD